MNIKPEMVGLLPWDEFHDKVINDPDFSIRCSGITTSMLLDVIDYAICEGTAHTMRYTTILVKIAKGYLNKINFINNRVAHNNIKALCNIDHLHGYHNAKLFVDHYAWKTIDFNTISRLFAIDSYLKYGKCN